MIRRMAGVVIYFSFCFSLATYSLFKLFVTFPPCLRKLGLVVTNLSKNILILKEPSHYTLVACCFIGLCGRPCLL